MRGKKAKKRKLKKDARYDNQIVGRFISKIMQHGKRNKARKMFYNALDSAVEKVGGDDPIEFINEVIDNVRPSLEIRARRVGGANYQVPVPVDATRQETLAIRWIVQNARNTSGKAFSKILEKELVDAYKGEGAAVKKKEDTERMAEANKAFAHFRW